MIPRCYLPMIPSGKMCKNLANQFCSLHWVMTQCRHILCGRSAGVNVSPALWMDKHARKNAVRQANSWKHRKNVRRSDKWGNEMFWANRKGKTASSVEKVTRNRFMRKPLWYQAGKCARILQILQPAPGHLSGLTRMALGTRLKVLEQEHRSVENVEWGSVESECDLAEDTHGDIECPTNEKRLVHATHNSSVCHATAVYSPTTFNFPTVDGLLLKNGKTLTSIGSRLRYRLLTLNCRNLRKRTVDSAPRADFRRICMGLGNLSLISLPTQQNGGRKPWKGLAGTHTTIPQRLMGWFQSQQTPSGGLWQACHGYHYLFPPD